MRLHSLHSGGPRQSGSRADAALAWPLFQCDPLAARVAPEKGVELVNLALDAGVRAADRALEEVGKPDPFRAASKWGVRILSEVSEWPGGDALAILAGYRAEPPTIVVFESVLRSLREKAGVFGEFPELYRLNLTNICVAHELYHHFERMEFFHINLRHSVTVLDFGIFRIEKSMRMLSEIAAHAFAKRFLRLPILPCCLDACFRQSREAGAPMRKKAEPVGRIPAFGAMAP